MNYFHNSLGRQLSRFLFNCQIGILTSPGSVQMNDLSAIPSGKTKLLQEISLQFDNRYSAEAEGPFQVLMIDGRIEENLGNIHPMVIGKKFRSVGISALNIEKQSNDKISILFNSAVEANNFVDSNVKLVDNNWIAFIPSSSTQFVGLIRDVPIEFETIDILDGIDNTEIKEQIVDIIRIKRKNRPNQDRESSNQGVDQLVETDSVKILFRNKLPDNIYINFCFRKIYKFIPPVRRCYNCQRFGHISSKCKSVSRCNNCGKHHDMGKVCEINPKCINCEGKHQASDVNCPFYKFYKEVNKVKTLFNKNYFEAQEIVKNRLLNKFNSSDRDNSDDSIGKIVKSLNLDVSKTNPHFDKPIPEANSTIKNSEKGVLEDLQREIIIAECNKATIEAFQIHSEKVVNFLTEFLGENHKIIKEYKSLDSNFFGCVNCVEGSEIEDENSNSDSGDFEMGS